ncbi:cytochrome b [Rhodopila globiformis]|uniref:cytochrome b n=1 Tax=Rhodopila globiformis TaxID=1071 RepID=UPI0013048650|nr:cytochrome b/b6 domain-containing protein [Rhodopila globiformis]
MSIAVSVPAPARYTLLARTFHWTIAVLMAGMFITMFLHQGAAENSPAALYWIKAHMSLGLLVFGLSLLRLLARQTPPEPLSRGIARLAAVGMQKLLLLVTLLLPVTGFLRVMTHGYAVSFFGYTIPSVTGNMPGVNAIFKVLHGGAMPLIVLTLIGLHIAAALFHHFVLKDATLKQMV